MPETKRHPKVRKWVTVIIGSIVLVALAVASAAAYVIGPRNVIGMLRYDQRQEGALTVGQEAPDVELTRLDGRTRMHLRSFLGSKPLVLVFGSYT